MKKGGAVCEWERKRDIGGRGCFTAKEGERRGKGGRKGKGDDS